MQVVSRSAFIGVVITLAGGAAFGQSVPSVSDTKEQVTGQDPSSAAKEALNNIQSARTNISKKKYPSAKTDISQARANLKDLESSSGVGKAMGMTGEKTGISSLSSVDKQLADAEEALANNQPKAADALLKKAEGPLKSMG